MVTRCLGTDASGRPCRRDVPEGYAHCPHHTRRLLREAFGPQSWTDRAAVNELPSMVVGGIPLTTQPSTQPHPLGVLRARLAGEPVTAG